MYISRGYNVNLAQDQQDQSAFQPITAASWNVSAINTNPFQYLSTCYTFRPCIQRAHERRPRSHRPPRKKTHQIFTDAMFSESVEELHASSIGGLGLLRRHWVADYRQRTAAAGFPDSCGFLNPGFAAGFPTAAAGFLKDAMTLGSASSGSPPSRTASPTHPTRLADGGARAPAAAHRDQRLRAAPPQKSTA